MGHVTIGFCVEAFSSFLDMNPEAIDSILFTKLLCQY